ncbi:MAG: DUF4178 domain-containing protein [Rickettsiales bacterium]|jgi:hypothetical protein|nr:DUF4178 domain-containing protein [Rickettsiales bacterium]
MENINIDSVLQIDGQKYIVLGKALYHAGLDKYYKIFLSEHHILVFTNHKVPIIFGKVVPALPYSVPFPKEIEYNGEKFKKDSSEHQVVDELIFGDVEGECDFHDYINENKVISIAVLASGERADVYGKNISIQDIQIIFL